MSLCVDYKLQHFIATCLFYTLHLSKNSVKWEVHLMGNFVPAFLSSSIQFFFINIVYFYQWIGAAHSIRWSKIVFLPFPPFLHLFGTCFESSSFRCEKEKKCYPHKTETQQDHCLVIKPLTSSQKTTLLPQFCCFFFHFRLFGTKNVEKE